jgi:hypothetical protein
MKTKKDTRHQRVGGRSLYKINLIIEVGIKGLVYIKAKLLSWTQKCITIFRLSVNMNYYQI